MEVRGELLRRHYNYALGQRLDWLRRTRCQFDRCSIVSEPIGDLPEKVDYYSQASELKQTKELFPEYKNIYADCQQQNLMRLDKASKRWLIPDKNGKRGGRPRFKKRGDICSFTFPRVNCPKAGAHLTGNILKLSKIGEIEVVLHRPIPDGFAIKQATLLRKADGWYVSFSLEDGTIPDLLPVVDILPTPTLCFWRGIPKYNYLSSCFLAPGFTDLLCSALTVAPQASQRAHGGNPMSDWR